MRAAFRLSYLLLLSPAACSFIDDFDKFKGRPASPDGSALPGDEDAAVDGAIDTDGGELDADVEDGGTAPDAASGDLQCAGKTDGTACGPEGSLICLRGFCRTSRCGDGFLNMAAGERCDDANLTRDDGCEPTCVYSCETAADCDNGTICDGEEQCDVLSHRCLKDEVPATGKRCGKDEKGTCERGYCVPDGCGNGLRDGDEQCDPTDPAVMPGCRLDCTQGCTTNSQCGDNDVCDGTETCTPATGECVAGTALSCDDGDPCTDDRECLPESGCNPRLIDADGDGVSAQTCAPGSVHKGGDCDDNDGATYPGAVEYCDGKSNDCDDQVDEGAVMATCYHDRDGDGYPTRVGSEVRCSCPAGMRVARSDGVFDCWDDPRSGGADVHPGQRNFYATGYPALCPGGNATCVSFDYDCNGNQERQTTAVNASCGLLGLPINLVCTGSSGYVAATAPACGVSGSYLVCSGGAVGCGQATTPRTQQCR